MPSSLGCFARQVHQQQRQQWLPQFHLDEDALPRQRALPARLSGQGHLQTIRRAARPASRRRFPLIPGHQKAGRKLFATLLPGRSPLERRALLNHNRDADFLYNVWRKLARAILARSFHVEEGLRQCLTPFQCHRCISMEQAESRGWRGRLPRIGEKRIVARRNLLTRDRQVLSLAFVGARVWNRWT